MATAHPLVFVDFSQFGANGLTARVTGANSFDGTVAYWTQIVERVQRDAPKLLLVLDDLVGTELTPAQWNDLVHAMGGRGLETLRIAHVKRSGFGNANYCEFYATLAGLTARAFHHRAEAVSWLRNGSASDNEHQAFKWARPQDIADG